ncbi:MAG: tetratricopeptide repeat protein [Verrucomicrobiales bacterium]|nr:MAG: tetratricopeptide repeat protein [Verrucomicrobiales bacterium]
MNLYRQSLALLLVVTFITIMGSGCTSTYTPVSAKVSGLTPQTARAQLIEVVRDIRGINNDWATVDSLIITSTGVQVRGHFTDAQGGSFFLRLPYDKVGSLRFENDHNTVEWVVEAIGKYKMYTSSAVINWRSEKPAIEFANAMRVLSESSAKGENVAGEEPMDFEKVAERYIAANPKPPLSEDLRKLSVQAEFAFQKKQYDEAVSLYGQALAIAPWWPKGRFNRALLLSELERYEQAIAEMKKYLMLVPGAQDARAAQDRIYQWEAEVAKAGAPGGEFRVIGRAR